jgi:hypothetical protein
MLAKELAAADYGVLYVYYRWNEMDALPNDRLSGIIQMPNDMFFTLAPSVAVNGGGMERLALFSIPDHVACATVGLFDAEGWATVYEVRDDWEEFAAAGVGKSWYRPALERYMASAAQRVICVSELLAAKMRVLRGEHESVTVVPNATSRAFVDAAAPYRLLRRRSPRPVRQPTIGYFGHLTEAWFDWTLLEHEARRHPDWRFHLVGFGAPDRHLPANLRVDLAVPQLELPRVTADWDAAMIPFVHSVLARAVDPIKVYDYLSLGLPVVSVPMGQIETLPGTYTYESRAGFEAACTKALTRDALEAAAKFEPSEHTWAARFEAITPGFSSAPEEPAR